MDSILITEAFELHRKAPANLRGGDDILFEKSRHRSLAPAHLYHYHKACVTAEGIVFSRLKVEKQLLIYPYHAKTYNALYVLSSRLKRKKVKLPEGEKYLLIFDYWSNSIFHWMCDALPRLQAVKEFAEECVVLLPSHFRYPYIHETLKAFKVKAVHIFDPKNYLECPELYVPEQITISGEINPVNFCALRETLLAYFKPRFRDRHNYPNIYISRTKAKHRKILNESELNAVLQKYDFKIIHYEDHTVEEQVEIAYNAKNMISAHGANLTNVIFMQAGGNVLEFRKNNDPDNNYFYSITDSVGCNYYYQNCDFVDRKLGNFFDLTVDIGQLESNIQNMLGR
jgi:hypothetical protein